MALFGSPAKMQISSIEHSMMDPEKSTVMLEARIEIRANALYSPRGMITLPEESRRIVRSETGRDDGLLQPTGYAGNSVAGSARFRRGELKRAEPPVPAHGPPLTLTGSAFVGLLLPGPSIRDPNIRIRAQSRRMGRMNVYDLVARLNQIIRWNRRPVVLCSQLRRSRG